LFDPFNQLLVDKLNIEEEVVDHVGVKHLRNQQLKEIIRDAFAHLVLFSGFQFVIVDLDHD